MSVYGELDPMVEHRTQFAFKGKWENIAKVNMPNIAYPNQYIDIKILGSRDHGSRDHVIIPDTVKITFNLDIKSADKSRNVVNNVGRELVKKKVLLLGSKEIYTINNSDIYDTYKDLYLSKKECEERLLQGIQSIPYTKVTSIHHVLLEKQDTTWKIDVNNLSARSLQGLLLIFLDKRDHFANKNEEFYNRSIKKIGITINGMPHQLFAGALQARDYRTGKDSKYTNDLDVNNALFCPTSAALSA